MPSRPDAERPPADRPRPSNASVGGLGTGGGWGGFGGGVSGTEGGGAGGQVHFQAGLGFFPSLFGLQFVSDNFGWPSRVERPGVVCRWFSILDDVLRLSVDEFSHIFVSPRWLLARSKASPSRPKQHILLAKDLENPLTINRQKRKGQPLAERPGRSTAGQ